MCATSSGAWLRTMVPSCLGKGCPWAQHHFPCSAFLFVSSGAHAHAKRGLRARGFWCLTWLRFVFRLSRKKEQGTACTSGGTRGFAISSSAIRRRPAWGGRASSQTSVASEVCGIAVVPSLTRWAQTARRRTVNADCTPGSN